MYDTNAENERLRKALENILHEALMDMTDGRGAIFGLAQDALKNDCNHVWDGDICSKCYINSDNVTKDIES